MATKIQLTEDGLISLQNELESLKNEKRKEIAEKLKEAISYGDLSENSEYQEARDDQAAIEMRISDLEEQLQNYEIVEADHNTAHQLTVNIGNSVVIQKMNGNKVIYLVWDQYPQESMNWHFCDFELKELKHLKFIFLFN